MRNSSEVSTQHRDSPLSYRAALRHTFGGMMISSGLLLLSLGGYFILEQFVDPFRSNEAGLLFAAVLITTGMILLSYLIDPGLHRRTTAAACEMLEPAKRKTIAGAKAPIEVGVAEAPDALGICESHREFALHNRYVDHARVRP